MPVIKIRPERLNKLLPGMSMEEIEEALFKLKGEVEIGEDGYIYVELNPDRPDMYIGEGIVRAVKGLLGVERGYTPPRVRQAGVEVVADRVVSRPFISVAVVYNVGIDEEFMEELIQFQEKLHDTIGRRRRKMAIGLHDLDKIPSSRIMYKELPVTQARFKPLHHEEMMSAR